MVKGIRRRNRKLGKKKKKNAKSTNYKNCSKNTYEKCIYKRPL